MRSQGCSRIAATWRRHIAHYSRRLRCAFALFPSPSLPLHPIPAAPLPSLPHLSLLIVMFHVKTKLVLVLFVGVEGTLPNAPSLPIFRCCEGVSSREHCQRPMSCAGDMSNRISLCGNICSDNIPNMRVEVQKVQWIGFNAVQFISCRPSRPKDVTERM